MPWANDGGPSWNATRCTPLAEDPKQPGEPCTVEGDGASGVDDCDRRVQCWDVDPETSMGTCVAMCIGSEASPSCEAPCSYCTITANGIPILCLPQCDLLAQDCGAGLGCYPFFYADSVFVCSPDASGDMGAIGDPCEFINACDPGSYCADAALVPGCEGVGCCAPFCDASAEDACPSMLEGTECIPFFAEGEAACFRSFVGACLLPE
jgi:hypothetical protein